MRKFLMVAALLAVAACGEKKADDSMSTDSTPAPAAEMAPAGTTVDTIVKTDSTIVKKTVDTTTTE